jgi:hypothetical protein
MKKENKNTGVENWPTAKLVVVVIGSMLLFLALLLAVATFRNLLIGYIVFSLYIILGLAMVIEHEVIGGAIFEASMGMLVWVGRWIFMMKEDKLQKHLREIESCPSGYNFNIGITLFVGLGLIAISIWAIVMMAKGGFFN